MLGAHRRCEGNTVVSESRLDSVARWLANAGTRRNVVRAGAGVAVTLAGIARTPSRAEAEAPPPIPNSSLDPWPVCSETQHFYCVEAFTADGIDQLTAGEPAYTAWVAADREYVDGGVEADRLQWQVYPKSGELDLDDLQREVHLRVQSGLLEPVASFLRAGRVSMNVGGSAASGWNVEIVGKPGVVPGVNDINNHEQADELYVWFQGSALHRTARSLSGWGGFEGYMAADGIQGFSAPSWRGDGWNVHLESVHLLPDGKVNHGSYRAWVAPPALQRLGVTPAQAISGALLIARIDNGVESTVAAELSESDGGVLIEIPDLTFSSPTISIRKAGKGGCATKCRKGRVCRNGRCKKKRKHGKH